MKIIVTVGQIASGKGVLKDYLVNKYGAIQFRFSDIMREILRLLYLEETRENLSKISLILMKTKNSPCSLARG